MAIFELAGNLLAFVFLEIDRADDAYAYEHQDGSEQCVDNHLVFSVVL